MSGVDEVYVVGAGRFQLAKHVCQSFHRNRLSVVIVADAVVLTVYTAQGTTGEKYGAGATGAADTGLLAKV